MISQTHLDCLEREDKVRVSELRQTIAEAYAKYEGEVISPETIGREEALKVIKGVWNNLGIDKLNQEYHKKNAEAVVAFLKYNHKAEEANMRMYPYFTR